MQLQDLTVFATVASERSFSRAAKRLHRTQPAVSQAIRRLEEELGDRLFDRSSRDGTLTEAGRLLVPHAQEIFEQMQRARAHLEAARTLQTGELVIGTSDTLHLSGSAAFSITQGGTEQVVIVCEVKRAAVKDVDGPAVGAGALLRRCRLRASLTPIT